MNNFQRAPLEEWMDSIFDYRGKTPEKTTSGIPLVTAKVIKDGRIETPDEFIAPEAYDEWMRRGVPKAGDVVITTEAPLGEVAQLPKGKVALAQRVITLSGKSDSVDNTYLKYLLLSRPFQEDLHARATGTTVVGIKQSVLRKIDLSFPGLSQQQVIAHILGTLDVKIELNRKTNETLEAMAKTLFQSWFVDFDPVRAKAEGRSTGLPDEISDLFPDSFEESELGEIPRGWHIGCLRDCCEITMGQSPPGDTYNEEGDGLPFYQGKTDFGFRFPGRRIYCTSPTRTASEGATLISVRAPVGSANIAKELCAIGRGIAALKSRQDAESFVYYLIGTLKSVFESYNSEGTVFGAINGKDLASILVAVPDGKAISAFNAKCFSIDELIKKNTEEAENLASIRDILLPKLISGELRIPEAEKLLEQAGV